jgi:cysteine desulfurase
MLPYFSEQYGNAASHTHLMGTMAKDAVESARESVAALINAHPQEITFTSGATEGLNTALKGIFYKYASKGKHFVSAATEHKAVLDTLGWLVKQGAELTILPVNEKGELNLETLAKSIRRDTVAVAIMYANNETGVIHPMEQISAIVHDKNSILVCDGTQAIGKIPVNVQQSGVDVLAFSAHKCYGPKGVGALYVRRKNPRVVLDPLLHGGGHERGLRSGTLNVPGIVALGKCAELAPGWIAKYSGEILSLKAMLEDALCSDGRAIVNGKGANILPNTLNVRLLNTKAETVIQHIRNRIALSTGSACSSANPEPSHVLLAMGLTEKEAHHSLRLSLGIGNTREEMEEIIQILGEL